ncbi:MAG: DNA replication and repair protein RecF, partial [Bacteroidetes bacterium]
KDRALGYTSSGIHRDDLQFRINGRTVRHYGSQGQQKTFVIALKLAQYTLLGERSGTAPLLLLDDIFDKLDEKRLQRIARILETDVSGQIFLTDTSRERMEALFAEAGRDARFFNVMAGQIQS